MKKEEKERLHEDDQFVKFVSRVWDRITERRRVVTMVLVIVVGGLLAAAVITALRQESGDRRRTAIDGAETIEEMEEVAKTYSSAPDLLLRLGASYAVRGEDGDLEKAESTLESAHRSAGDDFERALVSLELGKVKLDRGKHEEALKLFETAAKNRATQALIKDSANWHAARCLELLGRRKDAEERYTRVGVGGADGRGGTWKVLAAYRQSKMRQEALE